MSKGPNCKRKSRPNKKWKTIRQEEIHRTDEKTRYGLLSKLSILHIKINILKKKKK